MGSGSTGRRGPGRPPSPDALSQAERSRLYRQRHAEELRLQRSRPAQRAVWRAWWEASAGDGLDYRCGGLQLAYALGVVDAAELEQLVAELSGGVGAAPPRERSDTTP